MKTTLELPEEELRRTMELTGARDESAAVTAALIAYNQRPHQSELLKYFGSCDDMMTVEELMAMREMGQHR